MRRQLILEFTKMTGAGNDFIVIDNRFYNFSDEELSRMAGRYCPRRTAVGADGLLALNTPSSSEHAYRMRYFNADGSRATMCGNGARCLARFAQLSGMTAPVLSFESDAGVFRAIVPDLPDGEIQLFVPPPCDFQADRQLQSQKVPVNGVHTIWTGTEHAVVMVSDLDSVPVATWGALIRHDAMLRPEGANTNFVEVVADGIIRVRTFEKGVEEETLACGTGALAAAVVARLLGKVQTTDVKVEMPGGTLRVRFSLHGNEVEDLVLEGPANIVYRGTLEVETALLR